MAQPSFALGALFKSQYIEALSLKEEPAHGLCKENRKKPYRSGAGPGVTYSSKLLKAIIYGNTVIHRW
jgi:hypothetical protein